MSRLINQFLNWGCKNYNFKNNLSWEIHRHSQKSLKNEQFLRHFFLLRQNKDISKKYMHTCKPSKTYFVSSQKPYPLKRMLSLFPDLIQPLSSTDSAILPYGSRNINATVQRTELELQSISSALFLLLLMMMMMIFFFVCLFY